MNKLPLLSLLAITVLLTTLSVDVYAFDPTQVNMTLNDVQTTSYSEFDVLTIFISFFNNDVDTASLSGYNMIYLNDTNANYWELSTDAHIEGMTDNCPVLNSTIPSGASDNLQLCFVLPKSVDLGYSLVLNNDYYMMDWEIEEYTLEYVPQEFTTTAADWCSNTISDSEFTNITESQINNGTISVMRGQSGTDVGAVIPDWVKTNACDWSNDLISDYVFLDGLYWLIDNGKIQLD
jgi:hypothetical protein